jgi:hypothetical protein
VASGELHGDFVGVKIKLHSFAKELEHAYNVLAARNIKDAGKDYSSIPEINGDLPHASCRNDLIVGCFYQVLPRRQRREFREEIMVAGDVI